MDFDDHDDGDGDGDEEMTPLPVTSSYDPPIHQPGLGLGAAAAHGGTPKPGDPTGGGSFFRTPGGSGEGGGGGSTGGGGGGTRYRECLKNHAVGIGGHAVDGCGEFMAAGVEGSIDALRCAACGCHRNFHRKESDSPTAFPSDPSASAAALSSPSAITAYPHHHQFSPYHRTPAGYLLHQQLAAVAAGHSMQRGGPLALPSTSHSAGRDEGGDDMAGLMGGPMVVAPMVGMMSLGSGGGPSESGGSGSAGKKRFRTKFTQEQKDKMLAFAERLGWRIQKHDEAAVQQFCEEVNVKRHVLKVWMHNNKHTLGKKP